MKRLVDVVVAAAALILLSPLILVIGALVRIRLGSPIFFRQPRIGLHGKEFTLVKFRTMLTPSASGHRMLEDADRLTEFGSWLRETSLDELPELWNVLVGDMSIVGPRPLLVEYLSRYDDEQRRRHEVRPGLTGWAQINGRNSDSWEQRFQRDVWYVDNQSFGLDVKIMLKTAWTVLRREGINQPGQRTREKFQGSRKCGD